MNSQEKISRILIAVEDSSYSDVAVKYGMMLARKMEAKIALVHADEIPLSTPFNADPMLSETPLMIPEMMDIQQRASNDLFQRIKDEYGDEIEISTYMRIGSAQDEILATAEEYKADLIILGTHGRTGLDHFISGSVSAGVAKRAKCPVLIIPKADA